MHTASMDYEWFRSRKTELGLKDAQIAEAAAKERSVVNKVMNGAGTLPHERADQLAALFDVPRVEILKRIGILRQDDIAAPDEGGRASKAPDQMVTRSVGSGETAEIIRLDLSLPMGPGATVDDYVEEEPLRFDLGYVQSFTRTPLHRLRIAQGVGDSMFPTLLSNDLVWIDTTQNQLLHSDRIYAASINGGAAIKRLRPVAGGSRVLVISDNKTVEAYEVDANEVAIWGRVIRFARDL
jgi:transcriptional regulator with XRE-family HTH domain